MLAEGWPEDNFTRTAALVLARDEQDLTATDLDYAQRLIEWLRSDDAPQFERPRAGPEG